MIALLALAVATQAAPSISSPPAGAPPGIGAPAIPSSLPRAEAISSAGFLLSQPRLRAVGDNVRLDGTVCRRPNRSLISPTRVQIDHLSATSDLIDTSFAYLPSLSQREDQRCAHYVAKLKTPPQSGDLVRVCLAQRTGACARSG